MRREEFLEHIGEQEEVDPREEAQGRAVFATPDEGVSGGEMRDIRALGQSWGQ
jgi:hypothetical protein